MGRGNSIPHDISVNPLLIKTDSEVGSGDVLDLGIVDMAIFSAGGVKIYFDNPITYELHHCTGTRQPFSNLPVERDKIWTILLRRENGMTKEVVIGCNGIVVANYKISSCDLGIHMEVYKRSPVKFLIPAGDTASDMIDHLGL